MSKISLADRVAVVTGAGRGIGRAYALELADRGARVVVNDLPGSDGVAETLELIESAGGKASASYRSVDTVEGGEGIAADALEAHGRIDILVQNAGILRAGLFDELSQKDIDAVIDVQLKAMFNVGRPVYRIMRDNRYGRIVNIGSGASFGLRGMSNYATAKAGQFGFTKTLAIEGAPHNIKVNLVMPNANSPMATEGRATMPGHESDPRLTQARSVMEGRYEGSTVAPLVAFLASEQCPVTGEFFSAMAGRYARVFIGLGKGWLAPDLEHMSAEHICAHFEEIRSTAEFIEPAQTRDEFEAVAERIRHLKAV